MNTNQLPVEELEEVVSCAYRNCGSPIPEGDAGKAIGGSYNGSYFCSHDCFTLETIATLDDSPTGKITQINMVKIVYRESSPSRDSAPVV
ncbi:hypothetical protein GOV12_07240 [Candidatus Pacearchaeota archaeon]|nr:hypothetical protein [Candidatus Pacearchaeota archaeon]